jgi:hypothetical protein
MRAIASSDGDGLLNVDRQPRLQLIDQSNDR